MDIIELIAIIILVAAIVFLVYYYIKSANDGNIDIKEILKFSPKKDNNINSLVDEEIQEKKSMGDKIKYTINPMLTLQMHFQKDWIPSWMKEVRN